MTKPDLQAEWAAQMRLPLSMFEFEYRLYSVALEAVENGDRIVVDLSGGGYCGCYPAAAQGDRTAIIVRDQINAWLVRLFGPPPQAGLPCLTCTQPLDPPHREAAVIVTTYARVPAPAAICCAPVCTVCWLRFPEPNSLMHQVMQAYRCWLPKFHLLNMCKPGHA